MFLQFDTDGSAQQYVEEQLTAGLPTGWTFRRDQEPLCWRIVRASVQGWADEDYILRVSGDRRWIIFFYGNSDRGSLGVHHVLLNAKVIDVMGLERFPLSKLLPHVVGQCEPNRWGLT